MLLGEPTSAPLRPAGEIVAAPAAPANNPGRFLRSRRLARDYERLPETGVAVIHAAVRRIMLRQVAG